MSSSGPKVGIAGVGNPLAESRTDAQDTRQVPPGGALAGENLQAGGVVPPVPVPNPSAPLPVGATALTPGQMLGLDGRSAPLAPHPPVAAVAGVQAEVVLPPRPTPSTRYVRVSADRPSNFQFKKVRDLTAGDLAGAPACNFRRIVIEKMNVGAGIGYELGSLLWLPVAGAGWLVGMVLAPIWAVIGLCRGLWIKAHPSPGKPPVSILHVVKKYVVGIPNAISSHCKFWPSIITTGGLGLLIGAGIGKAAGCRQVPYGVQVAIELANQEQDRKLGPLHFVVYWPACAFHQLDYGKRDLVRDLREKPEIWYFFDTAPQALRSELGET